jgi:hypothetical protein
VTGTEGGALDTASDDRPILWIQPEPSANETAAIVAAIVALLSVQPDERSLPSPSRWARAGRAEALRASGQPQSRLVSVGLTGASQNIY